MLHVSWMVSWLCVRISGYLCFALRSLFTDSPQHLLTICSLCPAPPDRRESTSPNTMYLLSSTPPQLNPVIHPSYEPSAKYQPIKHYQQTISHPRIDHVLSYRFSRSPRVSSHENHEFSSSSLLSCSCDWSIYSSLCVEWCCSCVCCQLLLIPWISWLYIYIGNLVMLAVSRSKCLSMLLLTCNACSLSKSQWDGRG
jgi:hypothetical protein